MNVKYQWRTLMFKKPEPCNACLLSNLWSYCLRSLFISVVSKQTYGQLILIATRDNVVLIRMGIADYLTSCCSKNNE